MRQESGGSGSRHVLHVIGGADTGGAMSHLLPLLTGLRESGCDARLLCLGPGGLAEAAGREGIPVDVVPMSHRLDARVMAYLYPRIASSEVALVHTHGMRANLPVRLVLLARRFLGRRAPALAVTVHSALSLDYSPRIARVYGVLDRAGGTVVDLTVYVSRALAAAAGRRSGREAVVPSGLTAEALSRGGSVPARAVASDGAATAGTVTVGTVARMVPVKDLNLLIEAVARARAEVPGLRLVLVGDGPERGELEAQARVLGLADRVRFAGEVRPAWPALAELDIYAVTSVSEGLPLSVLEAMAAGLPVVATDVGGLREAVAHGRTGVLVSREGGRDEVVERFAGALVDMARDGDRRRSFGRAGRRRVHSRFRASLTAAETLRAYRAVCPSPC